LSEYSNISDEYNNQPLSHVRKPDSQAQIEDEDKISLPAFRSMWRREEEDLLRQIKSQGMSWSTISQVGRGSHDT